MQGVNVSPHFGDKYFSYFMRIMVPTFFQVGHACHLSGFCRTEWSSRAYCFQLILSLNRSELSSQKDGSLLSDPWPPTRPVLPRALFLTFIHLIINKYLLNTYYKHTRCWRNGKEGNMITHFAMHARQRKLSNHCSGEVLQERHIKKYRLIEEVNTHRRNDIWIKSKVFTGQHLGDGKKMFMEESCART